MHADRHVFAPTLTPVDPLDPDLVAELTTFRRDLHAHPERGFQETRTAARVAAALRAWGVDVTEGRSRVR